jgi:hypothetical protein
MYSIGIFDVSIRHCFASALASLFQYCGAWQMRERSDTKAARSIVALEVILEKYQCIVRKNAHNKSLQLTA